MKPAVRHESFREVLPRLKREVGQVLKRVIVSLPRCISRCLLHPHLKANGAQCSPQSVVLGATSRDDHIHCGLFWCAPSVGRHLLEQGSPRAAVRF